MCPTKQTKAVLVRYIGDMTTGDTMTIKTSSTKTTSGESGAKTILLAAPRGYCAGVDRAVEAVERALELHGAPVYVRKEIVHNKYVVETLTGPRVRQQFEGGKRCEPQAGQKQCGPTEGPLPRVPHPPHHGKCPGGR